MYGNGLNGMFAAIVALAALAGAVILGLLLWLLPLLWSLIKPWLHAVTG